MGYDPAGALYKAVGTFETSFFSTGVFQKLEPDNDTSRTDYLALAGGINESSTLTVRRNTVFDMLDVPEVINHLAGTRWCAENDDVWANMSMYRDTFGDQLWRNIPFDMNASWGQRYGGSDPLDVTTDSCKSHPLFGGSTIIACDGPGAPDNFNRLYDVIIAVPETRQMYLRRMRSIIDQIVQPPGTPANALILENHIKSMTNLISAEASLDRAFWGFSPWAGGKTFEAGVGDLLTQFVAGRRQHFYVTHSITNTNRVIGIFSTNNAGIPLGQPFTAFISIAGVEFNPSSANQGQEYICLTNAEPFAVDLSGWKLDGAVQFTFAPGTVMPSNSVLYVSPDTRAFRARTTGPRGGQGLFAVGPFQGQLSARGETLSVVHSSGETMNTFTYPGAPTLSQQFLRISELMYHPSPLAGNTNNPEEFEFIELKNISTNTTLSLAGVRLTNGVDFTFTGSAVTSLAPGATVLVVRNTNAFAARYGGGFSIAGQFVGALANSGERLQLLDAVNEEILDFTYNNSWYPITDGLGFSLVPANVNQSFSLWDSKSGWRASGVSGGSPGTNDPAPPALVPVLVNEVLANESTPGGDAIELWNNTTNTADISGWWISDSFFSPYKFRVPPGTTIVPGGFIVFTESNFNPGGTGFAFGANGDDAYLFSADGPGNLTGYYHGFTFGNSAPGVSFGRHVISTGAEHFVAQRSNTLGFANSGPLVAPVVINEIHFRPPDLQVNGLAANNSDDEFIELRNLSTNAVPLFDPLHPTNTWHLRNAVDFDFPTNTSLPAGGSLLVVGFDPVASPAALAAFRTHNLVPINLPVFGPWSGGLDNNSDHVELKRPDAPDTNGVAPYILVEIGRAHV